MDFAPAEGQKKIITHLVRSGRFNNQSEVVREALRRMSDHELSYLSPPPLTAAEVKSIYRSARAAADQERKFGQAAFAAVRRVLQKGRAIVQTHGWNNL